MKIKIPLKGFLILLRTYLRTQIPRIILLAFLLACRIGLRMASPQIMRAFIDKAYTQAPLNTLLLSAGAFLGVALVTQVLAVVNTYIGESIAWTSTNALRLDLLRHVLGLDPTFHKAHTAGELTERIDSDVDALSNFFSRFAVDVIGNGALAIGVLVLLYRQGWWVGLGFTVFAIVGLAALMLQRAYVVKAYTAQHDIRAKFYGFAGELLDGTEDIRANGARPYVMQRFFAFLQRWRPLDSRATFAGYTHWMSNAVIVAVGDALAFSMSAYLWFRGEITLGVVYLIIDYARLVYTQIAELRGQITDLQHAEAGIARIQALFNEKSSLVDGQDGPLPAGAFAVSLRDVSFAYNDSLPSTALAMDEMLPEDEASPTDKEPDKGSAETERVLHNISFDLAQGKVMGLLGRTGSGKTTMARLLLRLYDPTDGGIYLNDRAMTSTELQEVRNRVALVTQEVQLFRASLRDNLTLFNSSIPDVQVKQTLRDLGLETWFEDLPEGLDTQLGAGELGLSAGQAQLVAFARVFLADPDLVILDEASSRLDPATEQLIERAIDKLLQDRTGIIIAHRLNTIQRADEILILEDGRIRELGSREALAADAASYFSHLLETGMAEVLA